MNDKKTNNPNPEMEIVDDIESIIDLDTQNDDSQKNSSHTKNKKFFSFNKKPKENSRSPYGNSIVAGEDRAFFELFSIHASTAKRLNRITMVSLCIAVIALVSNGVNGGTKFVPVLITQDDMGRLTPLGVAKNGVLKVNEEVIVGQIYIYLENLRSVSQDIKLENKRRKQLQLLTEPNDWKKIKEMFLQQLSDAGQDSISIEVTQIMPIRTSSKNAWKVQWVENYGNSNITKKYEAMFDTTIKKLETNNPELIALNFSGLQISNFTMSQVYDSNKKPNTQENNEYSNNQLN